ncbi:tyrosine-type recombinase/integrase [Natronoglycomyces albus]|uniref:Tyrosine-type recombinase/integrase n=1 Tax=Natronoglycomyces albus TaxID=2811108 RepID=A0A895XE20_9ACTN|nr:tyrosine-type recombinase/integrase [Natronoglycomyces albus]QSB04061.1 tyrosine-type recombinase/integrase [Natronoglycomyces albus]
MLGNQLPEPLMALLREAKSEQPRDDELVCPAATGSPLRRTNFRKQIWRPSLVRAGLLGEVFEIGENQWEGVWRRDGEVFSEIFPSEYEAVATVALREEGGLRFHDLRHSYATWLVTAGVPVNIAQRLLGHAQASTTLNRYTHVIADDGDDVRNIFDG